MKLESLSADVRERARKNIALVFQRLSSVGQSTVAAALKLSEATVSRRKNEGDYEEFAATLAVMGLKVVPIEFKCYRPDDIEPYIQLAKQHMRKVESVHDLQDDDPE